jgi:hypothetical protein
MSFSNPRYYGLRGWKRDNAKNPFQQRYHNCCWTLVPFNRYDVHAVMLMWLPNDWGNQYHAFGGGLDQIRS